MRLDSAIGIYEIVCEELRSVYVGQSRNVPTRLRGHKMKLRNGSYRGGSFGVVDLQADYDRLGVDAFRFNQVCSCEESELGMQERLLVKKYLDDGWKVYGYFLGQDDSGVVCRDEHRDVVSRVVRMLEGGKLTVSQLSSSLDGLEYM